MLVPRPYRVSKLTLLLVETTCSLLLKTFAQESSDEKGTKTTED